MICAFAAKQHEIKIWFAAGGMNPGEDPCFQQYYRIDFDGRSLTPLTTANAYHEVAFSADMAFYVDNYSRVDLPNIMELHRAGDVALVKEVERGDIADLIAAGFKPPEVFVAKGRDGKTDVWGVLMRSRATSMRRRNIPWWRTSMLARMGRSCPRRSGRSDITRSGLPYSSAFSTRSMKC